MPFVMTPLRDQRDFVLQSLKKSTLTDFPFLTDISNSAGSVEDNPLAHIGLEPGTRTELSFLSIIATGWNICNSWVAVAATMSISMASGGPMTLIYGIMIMFVLGGSAALTMAEVASVYPTAGGQYHWTSILSPDRVSRELVCYQSMRLYNSTRSLTIWQSYWCGIINTLGWIASVAGFIIPFPTIVFALVSFWNSDYVLHSWHQFLVFQTLNFLLTAYNIFLLKKSAWVMNIGCEFFRGNNYIPARWHCHLLTACTIFLSLHVDHRILRFHDYLRRRVKSKTKQPSCVDQL